MANKALREGSPEWAEEDENDWATSFPYNTLTTPPHQTYIVGGGISNKMAEDIDPEQLWDIDKYWNFEYYDYFDDDKLDPRGLWLASHSGKPDD